MHAWTCPANVNQGHLQLKVLLKTGEPKNRTKVMEHSVVLSFRANRRVKCSLHPRGRDAEASQKTFPAPRVEQEGWGSSHSVLTATAALKRVPPPS